MPAFPAPKNCVHAESFWQSRNENNRALSGERRVKSRWEVIRLSFHVALTKVDYKSIGFVTAPTPAAPSAAESVKTSDSRVLPASLAPRSSDGDSKRSPAANNCDIAQLINEFFRRIKTYFSYFSHSLFCSTLAFSRSQCDFNNYYETILFVLPSCWI